MLPTDGRTFRLSSTNNEVAVSSCVFVTQNNFAMDSKIADGAIRTIGWPNYSCSSRSLVLGALQLPDTCQQLFVDIAIQFNVSKFAFSLVMLLRSKWKIFSLFFSWLRMEMRISS